MDDNPHFLKSLAATLRRANYAAITAADSTEPYARLNDPAISIDAAVVDIVLADHDARNRDGITLTKSLKTRHTPFVILSANIADPADLERAGITCWISKHDSDWDAQLLEWLALNTTPAVYVSHERSPRAREVFEAVRTLGLRVLPGLPEGDGDWDVIRKPTLLRRFAFGVVLLPGDTAGAQRERAIRKWGYLEGALNPENVLALCEGPCADPTAEQECLPFDEEGGWKRVLETRLRAVSLVSNPPQSRSGEHPNE